MDSTQAAQEFLKEDTDVLAYIGPVDRTGYDSLCRALNDLTPKKNCMFSVVTFGGDPNAGFRIARALSHHYPDGQISILVPGYCKSAGTLICIGAHELVISDRGELGPLDIQVQKPDEMFKSASGLDIIRGLAYLQDAAMETFRNYLLDINQGSGLSTKSASEIASKLTIGLHEPIFAQIDPIRLGEMQAALTIAQEYGRRLNDRFKNLKRDALSKLSGSYPAHGFVIDRKEAKSLFNKIRAPKEHEFVIGELIANAFTNELSLNVGRVINCLDALLQTTDTQGGNKPEDLDANPQPQCPEPGEASGAVSTDDPGSASPTKQESIDGSHKADSQTGEGEQLHGTDNPSI